MRADMAKVIVERPRRVERATARGRAVAPEDLPSHEGMRAAHVRNWGGKVLNENLKPLRRYLERQVGRKWDKVYAEISLHLRPTSAVQQHVRDHLHHFVAVKPRRIHFPMKQRTGTDIWSQPFYVDRRTGLLCRTDRLPKSAAGGGRI